jgi:DNA polymerase III subunit chi
LKDELIMKQATFYSNLNDAPNGRWRAQLARSAGLSAVAAERYRSGKRVLLACESQAQAERSGRSALAARSAPTSCRTTWPAKGHAFWCPGRAVLAGQARQLAARSADQPFYLQFADFATAFHEVVDFVPYEDTLKQLARDRYKAYRSVGFHLTTATPPTH